MILFYFSNKKRAFLCRLFVFHQINFFDGINGIKNMYVKTYLASGNYTKSNNFTLSNGNVTNNKTIVTYYLNTYRLYLSRVVSIY